MNTPKDIQETLRQAILAAGISRYRLAKVSGVSEGVISHFVNRNRGLTMETGAKLAAALGLELRPVSRKARKEA
jgi:plasmid maintenance system antidote protein VapI